MLFQYCSDLHLEFDGNSRFLEKNPLIPSAEVLILAGDITYLRKDFYGNKFFDFISKNWKQTYFLPGNHEYYCGRDILSYDFSKPFAIRENVLLVNDCTIKIEEINLIFTTLWSKISKEKAPYIQNSVSDFDCIIYNGKRFNTDIFNNLHKKSMEFLKNEISKLKSERKIIITHHLPSNLCDAEEFKNSILNEAFTVNITDFVEKSNAEYWIYGHSHRNMPEITIGKTKLITNQFGYLQLKENKSFRLDKCFDV